MGRPIQTILTIVIVYALVVLLATFTNNPEETRELTQAGFSMTELVPLLPPTLVLLVLAGAAIIGVPIGIVVRGVRRDLKSSRRRRQRRNA